MDTAPIQQEPSVNYFLQNHLQYTSREDGSVWHFCNNTLTWFKNGYNKVQVDIDTEHLNVVNLEYFTHNELTITYWGRSGNEKLQVVVSILSNAHPFKISIWRRNYQQSVVSEKDWFTKLGPESNTVDLKDEYFYDRLEYNPLYLDSSLQLTPSEMIIRTKTDFRQYLAQTFNIVRCVRRKDESKPMFAYPWTSLKLDFFMFQSMFLNLWRSHLQHCLAEDDGFPSETAKIALKRFASIIGTGGIPGGGSRGSFFISNSNDPIHGKPVCYTDEEELFKNIQHVRLFFESFASSFERESVLNKHATKQQSLLESLTWKPSSSRSMRVVRISGDEFDTVSKDAHDCDLMSYDPQSSKRNEIHSKSNLRITVLDVEVAVFRYHCHLFLKEMLTLKTIIPNDDIFNYSHNYPGHHCDNGCYDD
jgi:hypothetical protein